MGKGNTEYTVVNGDSLVKIARSHGMSSAVDGARRIWQDKKNESLHSQATMSGRKVNRQIHVGGDKYEKYEHSKFAPGYRGYDKPDQIILYAGEKIWIPDTERIRHEITDDELLNGFIPEHGKKYELVFPAIRVLFNTENVSYADDDKYTLYGYDDNEQMTFKKTLTVKKDKIQNGDLIQLIFNGTPRKLRYTLEVEPEPDENGKKQEIKQLFAKLTYEQCSRC
jgi:hypothetical protein